MLYLRCVGRCLQLIRLVLCGSQVGVQGADLHLQRLGGSLHRHMHTVQLVDLYRASTEGEAAKKDAQIFHKERLTCNSMQPINASRDCNCKLTRAHINSYGTLPWPI